MQPAKGLLCKGAPGQLSMQKAALESVYFKVQVGGEWDGNGHSSTAGRVAVCEERDAGDPIG